MNGIRASEFIEAVCKRTFVRHPGNALASFCSNYKYSLQDQAQVTWVCVLVRKSHLHIAQSGWHL